MQQHNNISFTDLDSTVGVLPPQARGCGPDLHRTFAELNTDYLGDIYDPDMSQSRCYDPEDILMNGQPADGHPPKADAHPPKADAQGQAGPSYQPMQPYQGRFIRISSPFLLGFLAALSLAYIASKL